jgi:hypothetical protein
MSAAMQSIRQQAFGGPEVLELAEVERPVPLPTEVLVRVRAVGVNPGRGGDPVRAFLVARRAAVHSRLGCLRGG